MEETHKPKANELMETEDQLHEEMREEFRERLKSRLQLRVEAKERDLPEVRRLKKKGRPTCI
jgi:hypothetical protein